MAMNDDVDLLLHKMQRKSKNNITYENILAGPIKQASLEQVQ